MNGAVYCVSSTPRFCVRGELTEVELLFFVKHNKRSLNAHAKLQH